MKKKIVAVVAIGLMALLRAQADVAWVYDTSSRVETEPTQNEATLSGLGLGREIVEAELNGFAGGYSSYEYVWGDTMTFVLNTFLPPGIFVICR